MAESEEIVVIEEEKKKHGGWRGGGRKKGVPGVKHHESREFSLTNAIWDELTKVGREEYDMHRSRFVDRLVAAVLRENVDYYIQDHQLIGRNAAEFKRLTKDRHVTRYISMRLETWEMFDKLLAKTGWRRSKLLRNILVSQLILPQEKRIELDSIGSKGYVHPLKKADYGLSLNSPDDVEEFEEGIVDGTVNTGSDPESEEFEQKPVKSLKDENTQSFNLSSDDGNIAFNIEINKKKNLNLGENASVKSFNFSSDDCDILVTVEIRKKE